MSGQLVIPEAVQRNDLAAFAERALRLDDAAVIRLRRRTDGLVAAWVSTGFDVLAVRVVAGHLGVADLSCGADQLVRGLRGADASGHVDPGYPMDSAWRGVLPPDTGFTHLDDVPAAVLVDLARRGADLARDHGSAHGPPASLLDQDVLQVSSGDTAVACTDALRVRPDRNGFRAGVTVGRGDRAGAGSAGLAADRRPLRLGVPAARRSCSGAAVMARACTAT